MHDICHIFPKNGTETDGVSFEFLPTSEISEGLPRIQREKTLDGSVEYENHGFNHGDRNFVVRAYFSFSDIEKLRSIQRDETEIYLSIREALFLIYIESIDYKAGRGTITGMIRARYDIEYPDAYIPNLLTHGIWYDSDFYVAGNCSGDIVYQIVAYKGYPFNPYEEWRNFGAGYNASTCAFEPGVAFAPDYGDPTGYDEHRRYGFLKVLSVTIPKGAVINSAYIGFVNAYVDIDNPAADIPLRIYAGVSSSYPTNITNAISKNHTTAYVTWATIEKQPGSIDNSYGLGDISWRGVVISADIKTILQEVIDSSEYSQGDDILFTIQPITSDGLDIYIDAYPFDFTQDMAETLYLRWDTSRDLYNPLEEEPNPEEWPFMSAHWDYESGSDLTVTASNSAQLGVAKDYDVAVNITDGFSYIDDSGYYRLEENLADRECGFGGQTGSGGA